MGIVKTTVDIDLELSCIDDSMLSEIDQERIDQKIVTRKSREYVNNKELYQEFVKYDELAKEAEKQGKPAPQMPHNIAVACMQISRRFCTSYRFYSYSQDWKEEMIQDAMLACVKNAMKFDIHRTENPFAFITTIVYNAVIERLNNESLEDYVKLKTYDMLHGYDAEAGEIENDGEVVEEVSEDNDIYSNRLNKIANYEARFGIGKPRKKYERKTNDIQLDL